MAKITFSDLTSLANDTSAVDTINANFALIETALENEVLYRDNPSGTNVLVNDLDFDSTYDLLNVVEINGEPVANLLAGATTASIAAQAAQTAAELAETNAEAAETAALAAQAAAETSETNAATSETNAAASAAAARSAASVDPGSQVLWTAAQVANTLVDTDNSGSVTLDFSEYNNFILTLTGNVTLANPTTETVGQSGFIVFKQDGTGSRTLTLGSEYLTAGGAGITLSTAASAIDIVPYVVSGSGEILLGAVSLAYA